MSGSVHQLVEIDASMLSKWQVGDGDYFWESNGNLQFPEMAGNVDVQLKQYTEVTSSHTTSM